MDNSININIKEFSKKFDEVYDYLYDNNDNVAGYDEAVSEFDTFAETHSSFVGAYVRYREDFISSDREAAAFMFTLKSLCA